MHCGQGANTLQAAGAGTMPAKMQLKAAEAEHNISCERASIQGGAPQRNSSYERATVRVGAPQRCGQEAEKRRAEAREQRSEGELLSEAEAREQRSERELLSRAEAREQRSSSQPRVIQRRGLKASGSLADGRVKFSEPRRMP